VFTPLTLRRALEATLAPLALDGPASLCVALSGGLDSTVLFVALAQLCRDVPCACTLRAIHVDHGLHADSAAWSDACAALARTWAVPCDRVAVTVGAAAGESPEAAARTARYAAMQARLQPGEVLLTAHHADDQLETILLQWLRGGGLRAVAGMDRLARFGDAAWLARPLLDFTRDDLRAWAASQALQWLEDPSNADRRFDRNYLRLEVLPKLAGRWPAASRTAGRVAAFARDALALEQEVALEDLARLLRGRTLEFAALVQLTDARQRAAVRAWLAGLGLPRPAMETLAALLRDFRAARADRIPEASWPGAVVRRYRGRLHADPRTPSGATGADRDIASRIEGPLRATGSARHEWAGGSSLEFVASSGDGLSRERLPARLTVRRRQGGESFRPAGGAHRRELRTWLQEHGVLPWRREDLPLLFDAAERLVAVADLACAEDFVARPGEPSWRIVWHGRGAVTESDAVGSLWRPGPAIG